MFRIAMGDSQSRGEAQTKEGRRTSVKSKTGLNSRKNKLKTKQLEFDDEENKQLIPEKQWKLCDDAKYESTGSILLAWGRERAFHLLGLFSLLMCAVLFTLQAFLAFRSYQIMHQLNTKSHIPELLYQIYFEGHDWAMNLDKVDLRANTTLYMH